jgi:hypothetical protein
LVLARNAALAACGLLMRAGVGLVGLIVVVGAIAPRSGPDAGARSEPCDPGRPGSPVVLTVPRGSLGENLTVVDGAGRELLVMTLWFNGSTSIVAHRSGGVEVSCFHSSKGPAELMFTGKEWQTYLRADPDGTAKIRSWRHIFDNRYHAPVCEP